MTAPVAIDHEGLDLAAFADAVLKAGDGQTLLEVIARHLDRLPIVWYVIHSREADGNIRKLLSRRCPPALRILPPGVWPSSTGESDGEVTIAVEDSFPGRAMFCRVFFNSRRRRTQARVKPTLMVVLRWALQRALAFEAEQRRQLAIKELPDPQQRQLFIFSRSGCLLDRLPADAALPVQSLYPYVHDLCDRRTITSGERLVDINGDTYELRHSWIASPARHQPRTLAVEARKRTTITSLLNSSFDSYTLTKREREIGQLLLQGLSNQDIAARLSVSADTVKTHCRHLFAKLKVGRRSEILQALRRNEPTDVEAARSAQPRSRITFAQRPALGQFWRGRYVQMNAGAAFLTNLKDGTRVRIEKGAVGYCYEMDGALILGFNRDMKAPIVPVFGESRFDYRVQLEPRLVPFLSVSVD
jgi:DNA-binding CsgD family transcriptional regulator